MIPPFEPDSGNLPPGLWETTWPEFESRYGYTEHRRALLSGLRAALDALHAAGCRRAYVNGSFITSEPSPNDFDGCWESDGVDFDLLDPVLLDVTPPRTTQKARYGGELFEVDSTVGGWRTALLHFFQRDRQGRPKGIIALDLGALT